MRLDSLENTSKKLYFKKYVYTNLPKKLGKSVDY